MADQFEIEIAIEEPGHASQLIDLGVHRIELCSNLNEGGLTPSAAQIEMTVDVSDLPVYVMLRPRAGDFIYNRLEKHMMLEELKILSDCGASGIVFGALDGGRNVDAEFVELVAQFAQDYGLGMTFHRAFDACARPEAAMELLVELGVERILTSGFGFIKGGNQREILKKSRIFSMFINQNNKKCVILRVLRKPNLMA